MADELLLDTGAFVALVDRSEKLHDDCVAALEAWTGPIVTTEAVLTETLYLVGPQWRAGQATAQRFPRHIALQVLSDWGTPYRRSRMARIYGSPRIVRLRPRADRQSEWFASEERLCR